MIYGDISEADTYHQLTRHPVWKQAFEWLKAAQRAGTRPPLGKQPLIGEDMFVSVMEYDTVAEAEARYESHRKYIDIQFTFEGAEKIDWQLAKLLGPDGGYDEAKDLQFYKPSAGSANVHMTPGRFVVFFPQDAHRPKLNDGRNKAVYKAVIKVGVKLVHE